MEIILALLFTLVGLSIIILLARFVVTNTIKIIELVSDFCNNKHKCI